MLVLFSSKHNFWSAESEVFCIIITAGVRYLYLEEKAWVQFRANKEKKKITEQKSIKGKHTREKR